MPFVREVFLMECHVAGTTHRDLAEVEPGLKQADSLVFRREPENAHGPLAIRILDAKGHDLGFVPQEKNEVIARLMDAGKLIFGRVESKEWRGRWLKIDVRVFLQD